MLLETMSEDFRIALTTSSTDTSFPSRIPTKTEPTGNGVIVLNPGGGGIAQNGMVLVPFGLGDDNDEFSVRITGWRAVGRNAPNTMMWIPVVLAELACVMSAVTGVTNGIIGATERFVDTITIVTGNAGVSIDVVSPTGDVVAHASLSFKGFSKVDFTFDMTTGAPTNANCLLAMM